MFVNINTFIFFRLAKSLRTDCLFKVNFKEFKFCWENFLNLTLKLAGKSSIIYKNEIHMNTISCIFF